MYYLLYKYHRGSMYNGTLNDNCIINEFKPHPFHLYADWERTKPRDSLKARPDTRRDRGFRPGVCENTRTCVWQPQGAALGMAGMIWL